MLSQSLWKWCTVCVQWTYRSIDDLNTPHTSQRNLLLGNSCVVGIAKMLHCFIFMKSFTKITLAGCVGVNASLAPLPFFRHHQRKYFTIFAIFMMRSNTFWFIRWLCVRADPFWCGNNIFNRIFFFAKYSPKKAGPRKKKTELKLSTWKCFGCNVICKWRRNHFVLIEKNCR